MYVLIMTETELLLLLIIIVVLTIVVAVLVWRLLRHQHELRDKNDVIIREIRENAKLRDELRDAWRRKTGEAKNFQKVLRTE